MSENIGTLLAAPWHGLATSALPNAPVVEEAVHPSATGAAVRLAIAAGLRGPATGSRWLAHRIEPAGSRYSAA